MPRPVTPNATQAGNPRRSCGGSRSASTRARLPDPVSAIAVDGAPAVLAAMLDGATRWQIFWRIYTPLVRGGIAATAVLCFIFSWTEFLMALFLTTTIRLLPVQLSLVVTQTWGFTSALSTAAIIPAFVFILLTQRHLARGLTMGLQKG